MPPPTFSVIIPAYNAAPTLARTIESVLAQTEPAHEIVVVDDGSTDETAEIAAAYPVLLVRKENGGLATARNAGVAASTGEFVVLLDADDLFLPRKLEATRLRLDQEPDLDLVTSDATVSFPGGTARWYAQIPWFDPPDQRLAILRSNFIFVSTAVRRSALDAVGGFAEDLATQGEGEAWVRLILDGSKAGRIEEELVVYDRSNPHAMSRQSPVGTLRRDIQLFERIVTRDDLSVEERDTTQARLDHSRSKLAAVEARVALAAGEPGARGLSWAVARDGRQPRGRRAKAAAAALLPSVARDRAASPWELPSED